LNLVRSWRFCPSFQIIEKALDPIDYFLQHMLLSSADDTALFFVLI